jgi:hypothetical protein
MYLSMEAVVEYRYVHFKSQSYLVQLLLSVLALMKRSQD